jgi:hypothetical protein
MTTLHHDRHPTRSERIMAVVIGVPVVSGVFGFLYETAYRGCPHDHTGVFLLGCALVAAAASTLVGRRP